VKPRVAVSSCLLGELVRYDGGHKRDESVLRLAERVELIGVCPEDEVGMGTPREPIKLDWRRRLVGTRSGIDHTDAMRAFAARRVAELGELDGWIFKARSPSCGLFTVEVDGAGPVGRGTFAEVVASLLPGLPVTEEEDLDEDFLDRVFAHRRERGAPG
jgi:uncharacterized protein YbbK (DUF523 family)